MSNESTKETILQKARRLFARHGFEGVSTRLICDKAKCNVSAISYHFGSKEELYRACLKMDGTNILTMMKNVLSPATDVHDLKAKLRLFLAQFYEYSVQNKELIHIISRDVSSRSTYETIHTVFQEFPETFTVFLADAQTKSIINKELDPRVLSKMVTNQVFMQVLFSDLSKSYFNQDIADSAFRDFLIDQQLRVLFKGIFD
jgi:AcrR family transcriptional regulator